MCKLAQPQTSMSEPILFFYRRLMFCGTNKVIMVVILISCYAAMRVVEVRLDCMDVSNVGPSAHA